MKNKTKEWLETAEGRLRRTLASARLRSPSPARTISRRLLFFLYFFPSFRPPSRTRRRADIVRPRRRRQKRKRRGAHGVHGRSQRRRPRRFAPLVPPTLPPPHAPLAPHPRARGHAHFHRDRLALDARDAAPTRRRLKRGKIRERPVKHRPRRRHGWFAVERRRAKRHGHHQKRRLVREGGVVSPHATAATPMGSMYAALRAPPQRPVSR